MAEWSIAAVLKTVVRASGPGVRIPLSPQIQANPRKRVFLFRKQHGKLALLAVGETKILKGLLEFDPPPNGIMTIIPLSPPSPAESASRRRRRALSAKVIPNGIEQSNSSTTRMMT